MKFHHIKVEVNSDNKPSSFIGSTLRGTFGYVLKNNVCIEPSYDCQRCIHKKSCLYYNYYESSSGFKKFRFDVRLKATNYDFRFYIYEDGTNIIRTILKTLYDVLHLNKITDKNLSFPKSTIFLNNNKILFDQRGTLLPFQLNTQTIFIEKYYKDIEIELLTPILLKEANSKFKRKILLDDMLTSIYKRKYFFENGKEVHKLDYTPEYKLIADDLEEIKTRRRSDRQNKVIELEGMVGRFVIMDLDAKSYELLKWGEIIAVGNKTVFGYGIIKIKTK